MLYSYDDVMVQPAVVSEINSRRECNPFNKDEMLPIFTAPMSTVVNLENRDKFEENNIYTIIPRNIDLQERLNSSLSGKWAAFSLKEFSNLFCNPYHVNTTDAIWRVLIDIANGHMQKMYDMVKTAKYIHGDKVQIMVGNIANPETYKVCYEAGVWGVRCSIGSGCGCITTSNTSICYPIASLISEIYQMKNDIFLHNNFLNKEREEMPKIIADGGVRNYSDVIKALALGADYVMVGSLFAAMDESAGETVVMDGKSYKEFYGMASREGQIAINGEKTKTSEGIKKYLPIIGNISQWTDNMTAYLRSAMSYCNIKDVKDFNPTNVTLNVVSNNTKNSINK